MTIILEPQSPGDHVQDLIRDPVRRRGSSTFASTLVEGRVAGQPLNMYIAGNDDEAKEKVAQLVRDGGLVAIDAGPLRRARQLEGLGFLGMTFQQPLWLNLQSAWKLTS